jgi:hypothetical protein
MTIRMCAWMGLNGEWPNREPMGFDGRIVSS